MIPEIDILREAEAAADRLKEQEHTLRARHADLTTERTRLFVALRSKPEVLDNVQRLVDAQAARWRELRGPMMVRSLSGSEEERWPTTGPMQIRTVAPRLPDIIQPTGTPGLTFEDLCGLVPSAVKAGLEALVNAMPVDTFGPPSVKRTATLAELDREIASVEEAHTALVDAMTGRGLTGFSLLSTVARRRDEAGR